MWINKQEEEEIIKTGKQPEVASVRIDKIAYVIRKLFWISLIFDCF